MPCSEGCEECDDGSPCVYKVKTTPRIILITIDGVAAMLSLVIGAMVFIFRESKVTLLAEIASRVLIYLDYILKKSRGFRLGCKYNRKRKFGNGLVKWYVVLFSGRYKTQGHRSYRGPFLEAPGNYRAR